MAVAVELPALGESVVEGTISRWLVAVGDHVEVDQPLVEVTTDKVDAEIPSPAAGAITEILVAEGDVVEVGAKLAEIDSEAKAEDAPAAAPTPAAEAPAAEASPARAPAEEPTDRPRATPVARRLAEEANVPLDGISGSGASGRITKDDVLRHTSDAAPGESAPSAPPAARQAEPAPAAPQAERPAPAPRRPAGRPAYASYSLKEGDRVVQMSPMRRIIAEHMVYSKRTSPHVGTVAEVRFE